MIAMIRGEVLEIGLDHAVVDAAGLGYQVNLTPAALSGLRRGEQCRLLTTLVVREDAMTLYGFADPDSRELFTVLQSVSGIGPRLSMAILAVLEPDEIGRAIAEEDLKTLQRVPGIGKRTAERMVVELRDKIAAPTAAPAAAGTAAAPADDGVRVQVVAGLVGLGFAEKAAEKATAAAAAEAPDADAATLLRTALSMLGTGR